MTLPEILLRVWLTVLAVFELFPIWELHQGATVSDVSPLLGDKVSNSPQFAQLYTLVLVFLIILRAVTAAAFRNRGVWIVCASAHALEAIYFGVAWAASNHRTESEADERMILLGVVCFNAVLFTLRAVMMPGGDVPRVKRTK